ncbi:DUF6115 domain-containing protein [Agathobacter sp.]
MTTLEITLIIIGVIFLIGSFMVNDKLSHKDLDKIADMSEKELKVIIEKELDSAKSAINDIIDEQITDKTAETKRSLEKETNSKIMAINEYSDTVLDSINKAHNEIMFLYSMLNDKHEELTKLSGNIEKISSQARDAFEPFEASKADTVPKPTITPQPKPVIPPQPVPDAPQNVVAAPEPSDSDSNHNLQILSLHKSGKSAVEIARELGLGTGEVKLVIDLFEEGN